MVQSEVADRLVAPPGSRTYGVPSVKTAWYAEAERAGSVPPPVFWPVPRVDSGLVAFTRRPAPETTATREEVFAVVDAAFAQRRKTLRAALAGWAGSPAAAEEALRGAGVEPSARGEQLGVADFARIAGPASRGGGGAGRDAVGSSLVPGSPDSVLPEPRSVTVRAPAKVNLLLQVGPRRDDGFHDLVTVFQAVSLHEEVTVTPAQEFSITVEGVGGTDVGGVPLDGTNLALRAARSLARRAGVDAAVHVHVRKGVPVAGGMAGGSADAAATLVACDALWRLRSGLDALAELGAELGSDVPFGLHGRTAVGTGRGERLVPVLTSASFAWVLVLGESGLSTPAVFAECDRRRAAAGHDATPGRLEAVEAALRSGDVGALGAALSNDLQDAACALAPALEGTIAAGLRAGAVAGVVSGSGPTVALLAPSTAAAARLARDLEPLFGAERLRTATGPVPGARVLEAVSSPVPGGRS